MENRSKTKNVRAGDGSWVENRPSKWRQTLNILSPYATEPINAMARFFNDPAIQYGLPPTEQTIADSLTLSSLVTGGSAFALKPRGAITMGAHPYADAPDTLMGFSKKNPSKSYSASNYSHAGDVAIDFGDGELFYDSMRGLNKDHILERARRNWPNAKSVTLVGKVYKYEPPKID